MFIKQWLSTALAAALLSGCLSAPEPLPQELRYQPPADLSSAATVRGSKEITKSRFIADRAAVIFNIDGRRNTHLLVDGASRSNRKASENNSLRPIYLSPGEHSLSVFYTMGGHITRPVDVGFTAHPKANYEVRFQTDIGTGFNSANTYADFWVIDLGSGQAVSDVVRGYPPPRASTTYIPIVVPSR